MTLSDSVHVYMYRPAAGPGSSLGSDEPSQIKKFFEAILVVFLQGGGLNLVR